MAFKKSNEYAAMLSPEFYEKCPKSVFAALAVGLGLIQTEENFKKIEPLLKEEWQILYDNGVVPQKPPK